MRWNDRWTIAFLFACLICLLATGTSLACTGLKLVGNDGTVVSYAHRNGANST